VFLSLFLCTKKTGIFHLFTREAPVGDTSVWALSVLARRPKHKQTTSPAPAYFLWELLEKTPSIWALLSIPGFGPAPTSFNFPFCLRSASYCSSLPGFARENTTGVGCSTMSATCAVTEFHDNPGFAPPFGLPVGFCLAS